MNIKQGGQLTTLADTKVKEIRISKRHDDSRMSELWINADSVSYLTVDELLDMKDEINAALEEIIKN